jgi:hypothetical protein
VKRPLDIRTLSLERLAEAMRRGRITLEAATAEIERRRAEGLSIDGRQLAEADQRPQPELHRRLVRERSR